MKKSFFDGVVSKVFVKKSFDLVALKVLAKYTLVCELKALVQINKSGAVDGARTHDPLRDRQVF